MLTCRGGVYVYLNMYACLPLVCWSVHGYGCVCLSVLVHVCVTMSVPFCLLVIKVLPLIVSTIRQSHEPAFMKILINMVKEVA